MLIVKFDYKIAHYSQIRSKTIVIIKGSTGNNFFFSILIGRQKVFENYPSQKMSIGAQKPKMIANFIKNQMSEYKKKHRKSTFSPLFEP